MTTSPFAEMQLDAREERNQEKDDGLYLATQYIWRVYQIKHYYGSVKKSKFSFGWRLQIDEKPIM